MDVKLDAINVFEIAEQIERNGMMFYGRAAELFKDADIKQMFGRLVEWEGSHERAFVAMKKELGEQEGGLETSESGGGELIDAKTMAGLAVFGVRPEPVNELSGSESLEEVLRMAIEKEKDSIVFYIGLRDFVPGRFGKEKIDDIIREEMRHIRILDQAIEQRQEN